jgi:hypothetical protein
MGVAGYRGDEGAGNSHSSCLREGGGCNVPKPIFSLETLTVHYLLLFGCVFAGLLMKLRIKVYMFDD